MDYNKIAKHYDNWYEWYFFSKEDEEVARMIWLQVWTILDIWCWTWLWIEITKADSKHYFWLDVSNKILEIAKKKNPEYKFFNWKVTDVIFDSKYDVAIALYWVMNYLTNEEIEKIIENAYSFFFMDYIDWYHPVCYPNNEYPKRQFDTEIFKKYFIWKFNNYNIYGNKWNKTK